VSERPDGGRRRLVVATRSEHKLRELRELLQLDHGELVSLDELGVPGDPIENGATFETNARIKARFAARATGLPALADDSGIEVDALGGAPGPRSARFAGEDADDDRNLRELLRAIAGVPGPGRAARYRAVAVIAWPGGVDIWAEGVCEGLLRDAPSGSGGFGYDPIFEPAGWERTMAELSPEEKDRISHRGRALRALREELA
jgi:XTP/dITP diphosphohydrolase